MNNYLKIGLLLMLILTAIVTSGYAQGIGGFFNQNATQKKYLLQQIAALQVYDSYLDEGYNVVKEGTSLIGDIKKNDLSLHSGHIDSLKIVSAAVRNYSRAKSTLQLQLHLIDTHNKIYPQLKKGKHLTVKELDSFNAIYQEMLKQSQTYLDELELVITNGKLSLTDNERIAKIDMLYKGMLDLYGKEQQLNNQVIALAAQRSRQKKDNQTLKFLYGQ